MTILRRLEKSKDFWFLLGTALVFFLLRLPSIYEPYWYGDEGIYQTIGLALQNGRVLYTEIWDNKPPLLYVTYALFGSEQWLVRLFSLVVGAVSVLVFFALAKKLFVKNRLAVYVTTLLFALLFATPFLEGNIANAENFMMLPILISAYYVFACTALRKNRRILFIAGVILGISLLYKIVAVFDAAAFIFFIFFLSTKEKLTKETFINALSKSAYFISGAFIAFLIATLILALQGAFLAFVQSIFLQMFGYVGYGNEFIFPHGLLVLKLLIVAGILFLLFIYRRRFSISALFVLIWFILGMFNAFFAQRPYTHYLLVLLPSIVLLIGIGIIDKKMRIIISILLIASLVVINKEFSPYKKIVPYYQNFISFVTSQKSVRAYYAFFDPHTVDDYDIVSYLKPRLLKNDNVYMFGNSAQIYPLLNKLPPGRFIVAYHTQFSKQTIAETENAFRKAKPKYAIIISYNNPPPFPLVGYQQKIIIGKASIYERALR